VAEPAEALSAPDCNLLYGVRAIAAWTGNDDGHVSSAHYRQNDTSVSAAERAGRVRAEIHPQQNLGKARSRGRCASERSAMLTLLRRTGEALGSREQLRKLRTDRLSATIERATGISCPLASVVNCTARDPTITQTTRIETPMVHCVMTATEEC
jgi:hypothetical protein